MAASWDFAEAKALLGIWGDADVADVQSQLDRIVRNKAIYQKVATAIAELGYVARGNSVESKSRISYRGIYKT